MSKYRFEDIPFGPLTLENVTDLATAAWYDDADPVNKEMAKRRGVAGSEMFKLRLIKLRLEGNKVQEEEANE
jgi:hypothetical protein